MSDKKSLNPLVPSQIVAEVHFPNCINNLGIIPTSYKDSMSYYEAMQWLCSFIENTVIPTVNQNGEAVEELQDKYADVIDTIPTKTSELENDSGFITNLVDDLLNYYNKTQSDNKYFVKENIVTTVSGSSTDSEVPSAKLFYDTVGDIETALQTLNTGGGVE